MSVTVLCIAFPEGQPFPFRFVIRDSVTGFSGGTIGQRPLLMTFHCVLKTLRIRTASFKSGLFSTAVLWTFIRSPLSLLYASNIHHFAVSSLFAQGKNTQREAEWHSFLRRRLRNISLGRRTLKSVSWSLRCHCKSPFCDTLSLTNTHKRDWQQPWRLPLARWSSSLGHCPPSHHFRFKISRRLFSCS